MRVVAIKGLATAVVLFCFGAAVFGVAVLRIGAITTATSAALSARWAAGLQAIVMRGLAVGLARPVEGASALVLGDGVDEAADDFFDGAGIGTVDAVGDFGDAVLVFLGGFIFGCRRLLPTTTILLPAMAARRARTGLFFACALRAFTIIIAPLAVAAFVLA